jgi:hypothetical protein
LTIDGRRQSHYEMYIEAMKDCGQVLWNWKFLEKLILYKIFFVAIKTSNLHPNIKSISRFHF